MNTGRDTPGVIAPPPLIYLGFLLAAAGLGWLLGEPSLGLPDQVRRIAAVVLVAVGLMLDGTAAFAFRRAGTAVEPWKPSTAIVAAGPYRFSRNPIYVGFALAYLGFAVGMDSPVTLACLIPCMIIVDRFVIAREERYLDAKFGEAWRAYARTVRRWL
ncbi:isoprenylcysteine carboxylmethyltransferase family protein [Brevundimonas sp.]|uniref:methyltransferase family protein n=1 Tax=Brevundimonas sp. TaxID=1871086 RepID=UPI0022C32488|nr:isoprenylcysteine carboxylmethyltransferase family protein [Brevundimonas sp.]MCZ8194697.1 isoprenylcysteine carboxylmethyltransferase family protein [Brevundimonas sp.]